MLFAEIDTHWVWTALGLVSIPAFVALNAFFVAAEFALVAIRRTRVEELVLQGARGAKALEKAVSHLDRSIAASQLGITLASLALGWVSEPALVRFIQPLFTFLPEQWGWFTAHGVAIFFTFLLITFLHVILGEQFPKTVALQEADWTALWVARPLNVFARLTRPLVYLMNAACNGLLKLLKFEPLSGEEAVHSVEELLMLIEDTEEAGVLKPEQANLLQKVFLLTNKKVADCMLPRDKIAALEMTTSPDKILEAVRETAHTRMPVYDGELDRIVGVVNTKDLFHLYSLRGVAVLDDAMYPALFLSPDEPIATALQLFRKAHRPMALVRDTDGKIRGLITLEDVLEEIVGDIEDEHDRPVPKLVLRRVKRKPGDKWPRK
jgi:magnesium and cobalt exporter, CNNM family